MRQNFNSNSADIYTYTHWVMIDKLCIDDTEVNKYENLIKVLSGIEFYWSIPMDKNRAADGLELRRDFEYETDLYLDGSSGLTIGCSVFEMIAALAYRWEHQLMRDFSKGDRSGIWFFEILDNLGILICDRDWKRGTDNYIREKVTKCLDRDYGSMGKGSMFPVRKRGANQQNQEIWKQLSCYIFENYDNSPDLELYRR